MMNLHKRRIPPLLLCIIMVLTVMMPLTASAQESDQKVVRVGWYESPFNYTDQNGRRSGYAYEYQKKIAAYTGWKYDYVEGSWPELLQMLMDGEIDLMSDVSYMMGTVHHAADTPPTVPKAVKPQDFPVVDHIDPSY